ADEPDAERVHRRAALVNFEVEMRASRQAARADIADQLPGTNIAARLRDDLAHVPVDAGDPAAVGNLHLAAITAAPASDDHTAITCDNVRTSPAGLDIHARVEAREVQYRVIAIAEVGGDRPLRRHRHA